MKAIVSVLSLSLLMACTALTGEEVARLPINQLSTDDELRIRETTINLTKGDELGIWSDMDIEYEGDVDLKFIIEILKDGKEFQTLELDPREKNISLGEVRTSIMGKTDWSFEGKNTEVEIEEYATYTFKAYLIASDNPSLKVTKAEIILKK